jgi:hypothetical protein
LRGLILVCIVININVNVLNIDRYHFNRLVSINVGRTCSSGSSLSLNLYFTWLRTLLDSTFLSSAAQWYVQVINLFIFNEILSLWVSFFLWISLSSRRHFSLLHLIFIKIDLRWVDSGPIIISLKWMIYFLEILLSFHVSRVNIIWNWIRPHLLSVKVRLVHLLWVHHLLLLMVQILTLNLSWICITSLIECSKIWVDCCRLINELILLVRIKTWV